jgi:hypothetical protein
MAASGHEDCQQELGAGCTQVADTQWSGPFPDGEQTEQRARDGFAICGLWCHDRVRSDDATLRPASAFGNGRDAEPVTGSCERRLGSFA